MIFFYHNINIMIKNKYFNLNDYKNLNPDLKFNTDDEYIDHYNNIGYEQMRLCNIGTLNVINEYGNENIIYIPYYHYLFKNNLLFENKIQTYKGMISHYYFLPENQIIEKEEKRIWTAPNENFLCVNNSDYYYKFNKKYWLPPNYKMHYKNNLFNFDKEILVINNKFNNEWNNGPVNYLSIDILEKIFFQLSNKYQIIYLRLQNINNSTLNISHDHNDILHFNDIEFIKNNFKNVIIFDDLFNGEFNKFNYNELKLNLFAICDNFISVQGGGCYFMSYFAKKLLIYHKEGGGELECNSYNGWFKEVCFENNLCVNVTRNYDDLLNKSYEMFI